jgi:flavin reductase (DIM6/NTAB) family NADH-FMN oxidoreductase RutF
MPVDDATFREVMSAFASGVAIVTAVDGQGVPRGLTTRSFMSVSAAPPLLLVSVDRTSRTLPAIRERGALVVNFLRGDRRALSDVFASKADDKFRGVRWVPSDIARGAPILVEDSIAYAECIVRDEVEEGDHFLVVAVVEGGRFLGGKPLMYYRRSYAEWPGTP